MTKRPQKFFKYRHAAGDAAKYLERTVLHNEIHYAAANSFNDPFDCTAVFSEETGTDEELMEDYIVLDREPCAPNGVMQIFETKIFRKSLFETNLGRQVLFDWIFSQIFVRK